MKVQYKILNYKITSIFRNKCNCYHLFGKDTNNTNGIELLRVKPYFNRLNIINTLVYKYNKEQIIFIK